LLNRGRASEPEHVHKPQFGFRQRFRFPRWQD
jgi:hypothetical protein